MSGGKEEEILVRVNVWTEFPLDLDKNVLYTTQTQFDRITWDPFAKAQTFGFLALLIDEPVNCSLRTPIIAVSHCDLLSPVTSPPKTSSITNVISADENLLEIWGETWTIENLGLRFGGVYSAIVNQPIKLSRIIAAVRCSATRLELEEALARGRLLEEVHAGRCIVRQGGGFWKFSGNVVVLKCEPVQQGLFVIGTEIVIAQVRTWILCIRLTSFCILYRCKCIPW